MMEVLSKYNLQEINLLSINIRILLAILLGGILGLERGRKNRPAGFRTYILVCLGSALVMMTNQYVYQSFEKADPVRMGAQVISGIGFLGAGTIITTGRNKIKGITTAAGLWTAACCGLAVGIGFYEGAVCGGISILCVMSALEKIDSMIHSKSQYIDVYIEFATKKSFREFIEFLRKSQIEVVNIQMEKNKTIKAEGMCSIISLHNTVRISHEDMITSLDKLPGVEYICEL